MAEEQRVCAISPRETKILLGILLLFYSMLEDLLGLTSPDLQKVIPEESCDEVFLKYLAECGGLGQALSPVLKVHEKLLKAKHTSAAALTETAMDYAVALLTHPEAFFPGETRRSAATHLVAHLASGRQLAFLESIAAKRSGSFEEIFILLTYAIGDTGKPAGAGEAWNGMGVLRDIVTKLDLFTSLMQLEGVATILESPAYWGIAPVDDLLCKEKEFLADVRMYRRSPAGAGAGQGAHGGLFLRGFFDGLLEGFIHIGDQRCDDLFRRSAMEKHRTILEFNRATELVCSEIHLCLKSLILKKKCLMDNFCGYIFAAFNKNKERMKTKYAREGVASDGYMHNLSRILMHFCRPFVQDFSKVAMVSPEFMEKNPFVDFSEFDPIERKLAYSPEDRDEKFVCKIFYGKVLINLVSIVGHAESLFENKKYYSNVKDRLESLEAQEHAQNDRLLQAQKAKARLVLEETESLIEAKEAVLNSPFVVENEMSFMFFEMEFISSLMKDDRILSLPQAVLDGVLVEILALVSTDVFKSRQYTYEELEKVQRKMVLFCGRVIRSEHVNVHLKERALNIIYGFTSERAPFVNGLVETLAAYYCSLQKTVRNNLQRISFRSHISAIITNMLKTKEYGELFRGIALEEPYRSFFVYLVSMLGDTMDYSLEEVRKVKHSEENLRKLQERQGDGGEEAADIYSSMMSAREMARNYFGIVWGEIRLISSLFELNKQAFLDKMILPRFVGMLNGTLVSLAGNKCKGLVIKDMEKCNFRPKKLLAEIVRLYLGMQSDEFLFCILRDEGVFRLEMFEKALRICESTRTLTMAEQSRFSMFINRLKNLPAVKDEYGGFDVPEEFIDPLTYAPMKDPVILRTSNTRVDRSTAEMILLNDPIDPFTRTPVTESDIVGDEELKDRIRRHFESPGRSDSH